MAGIDFDVVRKVAAMQQVLDLLGFESTRRFGDQLRGPCPVHGSTSKRSRSFSVHLARGRFCCHKCGAHGNQIELWAAVHNMTVYQAAVDLCQKLGLDVPWVRRW